MTTSQFWTWFQQNAQKIYILPLLSREEQHQMYKALVWHLDNYCKGLGYKIAFSKNQMGSATLTITAYGVKTLFPKVIELVDAAPKIDKWQIEAFFKPLEIVNEDLPYKFRNIEINLKDLRFKPVKYIKKSNKLRINIYFDNSIVPTPEIKEGDHYSFSNINLRPLFIFILEDLLGEMVLYERIKNFKIYRKYNDQEITYKLFHLKTYLDLTNQN